MSKRSSNQLRPVIEPLEPKRPLSTTATSSVLGEMSAGASNKNGTVSAETARPTTGFLVYRITNPNIHNKNALVPPFQQVLVQQTQPIAGQVYNILQIAVRNGTGQTFNASSGFTVKLSGQSQTTPILSGTETWAPGQEFVFYVLTKKYYPLQSQTAGGFEFDLGGAPSTAVPGPSGIFLRVKYNPATIAKVLNAIVVSGPGAQGGIGPKFGLPDTAIWEFLSAATRRNDFGGYF